jgi:hypothetical protein
MTGPFQKKQASRMPLLKRGVGERIYLMFAGRAGGFAGRDIPARPHGMLKFLPFLWLLGTACMIGVVIWRQISAMR